VALRLTVMRHAKSDRGAGFPDHERPLNPRGRRAAPLVAARIVELGWTPDAVISSDATRTRQTWEGMSAAFPGVEPRFARGLYLAGPAEIADAICRLGDEVKSALVLGHNPGFSFACHWFAGAAVDLKTADAALLEIEDQTWLSAAGRHDWTLIDVVRARDVDL